MNQNIELMPEPEKLKDLYKLTNNITQTIAHDRYATQEVCDKWQIPTHLFSVNIDLTKYKYYLPELCRHDLLKRWDWKIPRLYRFIQKMIWK